MNTPRTVVSVVLLALLTGCSLTPDDIFDKPLAEHAREQGHLQHWSIDDVHVYVNEVIRDGYYEPRRPELNGYCWEAAEQKFDLAVEAGHDPNDMRVAVIKLHPDIVDLNGLRQNATHAVLLVGDTVYDNGFLAESDIPFHVSELTRYGREIPNRWSEPRYR